MYLIAYHLLYGNNFKLLTHSRWGYPPREKTLLLQCTTISQAQEHIYAKGKPIFAPKQIIHAPHHALVANVFGASPIIAAHVANGDKTGISSHMKAASDLLTRHGIDPDNIWKQILQDVPLLDFLITHSVVRPDMDRHSQVRIVQETNEIAESRLQLSDRATQLHVEGRLFLTKDQPPVTEIPPYLSGFSSLLQEHIIDLAMKGILPLSGPVTVVLTRNGTYGSFCHHARHQARVLEGNPIPYSMDELGGYSPELSIIVNIHDPNTGEDRPIEQVLAIALEEYIHACILPISARFWGNWAHVFEEVIADEILKCVKMDHVPDEIKTKPEHFDLVSASFGRFIERLIKDYQLPTVLYSYLFNFYHIQEIIQLLSKNSLEQAISQLAETLDTQNQATLALLMLPPYFIHGGDWTQLRPTLWSFIDAIIVSTNPHHIQHDSFLGLDTAQIHDALRSMHENPLDALV